MKLLSLECSAIPASVAICDQGKLLAEFYSNIGLTHSATLMPMVEAVLNIANLKLDDIDGICIAAGPGSFTGVRIGISTLKGLAAPKNLPCVGVSTLEAMAYANTDFNGIIAPVMDARCNQCYCALFLSENGKITRLTKDTACALEEFAKELNDTAENQNTSVLVVGDGAELFIKNCGDKLKNAKLASRTSRYQVARGVAFASEQKFLMGETQTHKEIQPIYLRLPQAERELKKKLEAEK